MKLKKVTCFFVYLLSLSFLRPTLVNAEMDTASVSSNNIKAIIDYQNKTYSKSVAGFKKISPQKIKTKKYAYLFWGKKSCPFCRAFVPKLAEISQKRHIEIYYIDTTNTDTDPILKKMRKHFKVTGVPCLTKIKTYKSFKTLNRAKTSLSKFLTKQF